MSENAENLTSGDGELKLTGVEKAVRRQGHEALVAAAAARGGLDAVRDIPPVALTAELMPGVSPDSAEALLEPVVALRAVPNPLYAAVLELSGAKPISERAWVVPCTKKSPTRAFEAFGEATRLENALTGEQVSAAMSASRRKGLRGLNRRSGRAQRLDYLLRSAWQGMDAAYGTAFPSIPAYYELNGDLAVDGPHMLGTVILSEVPGKLFVKAATVNGYDPVNPDNNGNYTVITPELRLFDGCPDLNTLRPDAVRPPSMTDAATAVHAFDLLAGQGAPVIDPHGHVALLRERLLGSVLGQRVHGSPNLARIVAGADADASDPGEPREAAGFYEGIQPENPATTVRTATASQVAAMSDVTMLDSHVADMASLEAAAPAAIEGLRSYQAKIAGMHAATTYGLVNASAPGLGKTPTTLSGMRLRAQDAERFTALVVVPASLLTQWQRETQRFFPEAAATVIRSATLAAQIEESVAAGGAQVLICSRHTAVKLAGLLEAADGDGGFQIDDLAVDEAAILANSSSIQSKALWSLRERARCGLALTGTPIEKSLDDLGKLLAFARRDAELFNGMRLSKRFDVSTPDGVEEMWHHLGCAVQRFDRSEIEDELPAVETDTIVMDGTAAENRLSEAARRELRAMLNQMKDKLDAVAKMDPYDPDLPALRESVAEMRGAALGGITYARMAICDPQAAKASDSVCAHLLNHAGLVDPAVASGGTKRTRVVEVAAELAQAGSPVLIFTEFGTVAEHLHADLNAAGVATGLFTGKVTPAKRDGLKDQFQGVPCAAHRDRDGDGAVKGCQDCTQPTLDVMVLTSAGDEGLNLQRASVVINFEPVWVPSKLVQRIGRAVRFGSENRHVTVLNPVMAGTIEERALALLLPRAMTALMALDTQRGVDAADTELGQALTGMAQAVSQEERDAAGAGGMFAAAEAILG